MKNYFEYLSFLNPTLFNSLINDNYELLLNHLKNDFINAKDGDTFFHKYTVGDEIEKQHFPYERLRAYEILLSFLKDVDKDKFCEIHKGTPYFFIGILAFQIGDFEKSMFYFDNAISEDFRRDNNNQSTPAYKIFQLDNNFNEGNIALKIVATLTEKIQTEFDSFIKKFKDESVTINEKFDFTFFVEQFIKKIVNNNNRENTAIITSFYTFILEGEKREQELKLRVDERCSIEPFINHLFQGARLFETIIKFYNNNYTKNLAESLLDKQTNLEIVVNKFTGKSTLTDAVTFLNVNMSFQEKIIGVSYKVRNTTGHSLIWDDIFNGEAGVKAYTNLFECITNSILWTIYKLG